MENNLKIEELRQTGLAKIRANQIEESLGFFEEALALGPDEELAELLTINKAGALISLEKDSPEVQKLPQIIMRRRNQRHLYLAAYNLQHKYQIEKDFKRASFYARVALDAAEQSAELGWKTQVLIALGNLSVFDSRVTEAIAHYSEALALLPETPEHGFRRSFAQQNLGYCLLVEGRIQEGIDQIHSAIALMKECGADGYLAESYIDLCFGYLEQDNLEAARYFGREGLELATETRQVRNARYLLGEVAYKMGDVASAEVHFGELAAFYPDFPHLTDFLLAIDLRSMVNLKLS